MSAKLIGRKEVIERLGSEWLYDELRKAGKLRTHSYRPKTGFVGGRPSPLFLERHVESLRKERERRKRRPPGDLLTVAEAVEESGRTKETILGWVRHGAPALGGRKLNHVWKGRKKGREKGGRLYVSRADLHRINEVYLNPEGEPLPGNLGAWKDREVYVNHDGRWFVTKRYIDEHYGIDRDLVAIWIINKEAPDGGKLELLRPYRPSRGPHRPNPWVVALEDVERLHRYRQQSAASVLTIDGEEWASNTKLRELFGEQGFRENTPRVWKKRGVRVREQTVHVPRAGKGGRGLVTFFAVKDVMRALGLEVQETLAGGESVRPTESQPVNPKRRRRGQRGEGRETATRHERIKEEWASGRHPTQAALARFLGVSKSIVSMVLGESVQKKCST
jgi:hypothetical protein